METISLSTAFLDPLGKLYVKDPQKSQFELSKEATLVVEEAMSPLGFLSLPREIRDLIYEDIFLSSEPIYPSKARACVSPYINILRTNKQIYAEIVPILYGKNTFQIRGHPAFKSLEFLHLLNSQRREGYLHPPYRNNSLSQCCLARFHLTRLNIPSHGISLDRLKHLFSLLRHFPQLEYLQVVYLGKRDLVDMDVIAICRLLKDSRPLLGRSSKLLKRINFYQAEDITWTTHRPYYRWIPSPDRPASEHCWVSPDQPELRRQAIVVNVPQQIPE